jgi:hypothetical protein
MCTVTILPQGENNFVLTSNRDEAPNRTSLSPDFYTIDNTTMLFPKDELSGGTWIGVSDKNRLVCVLNGGFEYHERKASYRMSRGIVANDLLVSDSVENTIEAYNLKDIEPFTMVIAEWGKGLRILELVWNGQDKHFRQLPLEPGMWSSSSLYSHAMKQERMQWFESFKSENPLNSETLMHFHNSAGHGNTDFGVIMDRGLVKTTSITQVEKQGDTVTMRFNDLQKDQSTTTQFKLPLAVNE